MDNILAPLLKQGKCFHPGLVAPNYRASCTVFAVRKNTVSAAAPGVLI